MRKIVEEPQEEPVFLPDGVMGPFRPVTAAEIDQFNAFLADEIDSAFSSSVRCCDSCFDGFRDQWPGTTFRNLAFQRGAVPVELAVTQSRLQGLYEPVEIDTLRHFVRCPRCCNFVRGSIWIHEHPAADELEGDIERVGDLVRRTPFLVLEDPFARRVLAGIKRLFVTMAAKPLPRPLYRARAKSQIVTVPIGVIPFEEFGAPPAEYVREGRFNHAGLPMLYLADSIATTVAEIGAPGQEYYVAALDITGEYKILDLIAENFEEPELELLGAISASALVAAPRTGKGWIAKEYIFTRFVADCAIATGFNAIRYGSTKHAMGCNYVLLAPPKNISTIAALTKVELIVA